MTSQNARRQGEKGTWLFDCFAMPKKRRNYAPTQRPKAWPHAIPAPVGQHHPAAPGSEQKRSEAEQHAEAMLFLKHTESEPQQSSKADVGPVMTSQQVDPGAHATPVVGQQVKPAGGQDG